ncbi:hypothetical protein [Streptomyces venezuelae]
MAAGTRTMSRIGRRKTCRDRLDATRLAVLAVLGVDRRVRRTVQ